MQKVIFNSYCPFELKDKVREKLTGEEFIIEDILLVHSLRTQRAEFTIIAKGKKGVVKKEVEDLERIIEGE